MQTIVTVLAERARSQPASTAIVWQGTVIDTATFDALTTAGAMALINAGVGPGDRVLLHLPNGRELALAYYACFKAGATAAPVPRGASAVEIGQIVEACQPRIGLTHASISPAHLHSTPWLALDEHWPAATSQCRLPAVDADGIAVILYTSGTTGQARGVTHTHRSLRGLLNAYSGSPQTGITTVIPLPMVHSYALFTLVSMISTGGTVILLDDPAPEDLLDAIDRHLAKMAIATPALAHALAEVQARAPRRLTALSHINVSGDIVPLDLQQRFNQVFGNRMRRTYGSSEMGPIAAEPIGSVVINSLGFPFPGVEIRILDDNGCDVPTRQVGEIVIRSPSMAVGYWDDTAATTAAFRDGYLHTGDLGFRDEAMRLHFAGRKKELIVRAGWNISPLQIEDILRQHPAVDDVAVWGIPDAVLGQSVAAWVVPKKPVSAEQLCEFVRPQVAEHKCPERIFFVAALPKTAVGKVRRRALVPPASVQVNPLKS
ncbi:MAG: class I adenylate-forming enzyme family protein [Burkholderiales bacterium]|nr:class I adenylate-forming enzyme family protein [Burkholderiales bacterium]